MGITPGNWRIIKMKPSHGVELLGIEFECEAAVRINDVPKRNIRVAGAATHRLSCGQHQRCSRTFSEIEPEFLSQLAYHRGSRMLTWLDVPTARQPKLCILVIHEQYMIAIYQDKVRNKMLGWNRRLLKSAQLRTGVDPGQRIMAVHALKRVERLYGHNLFSDGAAHVFCWL
jgi:hypothetical protein